MSVNRVLDARSGNAFVVALDHGLGMGSIEGFRSPSETLETVLEADPDGVLVGPHFARQFHDRIAASGADLLVTADILLSAPSLWAGEGAVQAGTFEPGLVRSLDPAALKVMLVFGRDDPSRMRRNLQYVAAVIAEFREDPLPVIIEAVLWGQAIPDDERTDPDRLEDACRVAWELGADMVKIPFTGDGDSFQAVTEAIPIPALVLGGPASGTTTDLVEDIRSAVHNGARGAIIGRAVWQSGSPASVIGELKNAVHKE